MSIKKINMTKNVKQNKIDVRDNIMVSVSEPVMLKNKMQNAAKVPMSSFPSHLRLYLLNRNGDWTCAHDLNSPARLSKRGNVECTSLDGKHCITTHPRSCLLLKKNLPKNLKPLECGEMHLKKWGVTGYSDPNHWCSTTRNLLLHGAKAVLLDTRKKHVLATGSMRGNVFHVKSAEEDFFPILKKVAGCGIPNQDV